MATVFEVYVDKLTGLRLYDCSVLPPAIRPAFREALEPTHGLPSIFYLSAVVTMNGNGGAYYSAETRVLIVSREALYVCDEAANIIRCVRLKELRLLYVMREWVGIVVVGSYDILARVPSVDDFVRILRRLVPIVHAEPFTRGLDELKVKLQLLKPIGHRPDPPAPISKLARSEVYSAVEDFGRPDPYIWAEVDVSGPSDYVSTAEYPIPPHSFSIVSNGSGVMSPLDEEVPSVHDFPPVPPSIGILPVQPPSNLSPVPSNSRLYEGTTVSNMVNSGSPPPVQMSFQKPSHSQQSHVRPYFGNNNQSIPVPSSYDGSPSRHSAFGPIPPSPSQSIFKSDTAPNPPSRPSYSGTTEVNTVPSPPHSPRPTSNPTNTALPLPPTSDDISRIWTELSEQRSLLNKTQQHISDLKAPREVLSPERYSQAVSELEGITRYQRRLVTMMLAKTSQHTRPSSGH